MGSNYRGLFMLVSAIGLPAYRERILYGCLARYGGSSVRGVYALFHGLPACRSGMRCDAMPGKKKEKKGKVEDVAYACLARCALKEGDLKEKDGDQQEMKTTHTHTHTHTHKDKGREGEGEGGRVGEMN